MQQFYTCPYCGNQVTYGTPSCWYCNGLLTWQPQQPLYKQTDGYVQEQVSPLPIQQQLNRQQQVPSGGRGTTSVCINCEFQNSHDVDHNGDATVTCQSCSTVYDVKTYQVRAKGGRRDKSSGVKHYDIRVKEPDHDETILEFDSIHEIEMRSGDWVTGSYSKGKLKYLLNQTIKRYWDIQQGMGCLTMGLMLVALITLPITLLVVGLFVL
jgi:hypothetical protein